MVSMAMSQNTEDVLDADKLAEPHGVLIPMGLLFPDRAQVEETRRARRITGIFNGPVVPNIRARSDSANRRQETMNCKAAEEKNLSRSRIGV